MQMHYFCTNYKSFFFNKKPKYIVCGFLQKETNECLILVWHQDKFANSALTYVLIKQGEYTKQIHTTLQTFMETANTFNTYISYYFRAFPMPTS